MWHNSSTVQPGTKVVHIITSARTLLFLKDHIEVMASEGVEYHVIANFEKTRYASDGHRFHDVNMHRSLFRLSELKASFEVYKLLKHIDPDIIISSTPKAGLVGGVISALFFRSRKRIFLVRGFRFPTLTGFKRWLVRTMEVMPARFANLTLATSPQTAEMIREIMPQRYHHSVRVTLNGTANGIDTDRFSPDNRTLASSTEVRARYGISDDAFLILIVGRICVDKGFKELVNAFERLKKNHPHAELLVVGDDDPADPLPDDLQRRLNTISIRVGRLDNDKIPEVFRAADLLAYPSYREGFGVSAIEAAAMGTPTVASRVGGLQSAVAENISGVFHAPHDVDAIYGWLKHFIENSEELARLSSSSRQHVVEHFDRSLYDAFWLRIFRGQADIGARKEDEANTRNHTL